MTAIFGALLGKLWPFILAGFGVVIVAWRSYAKGKADQVAKRNQANLDAVKDKKAKDDEINSLNPADLDSKFNRWVPKQPKR